MSTIPSKILSQQFVSNCDNAFQVQGREQSGIMFRKWSVNVEMLSFCTDLQIFFVASVNWDMKGEAEFFSVLRLPATLPSLSTHLCRSYPWSCCPCISENGCVSCTVWSWQSARDAFTRGHRFALLKLNLGMMSSQNGPEFTSAASPNKGPTQVNWSLETRFRWTMHGLIYREGQYRQHTEQGGHRGRPASAWALWMAFDLFFCPEPGGKY